MKKLRVLFVLVISFLGFTTYVSADVCDNAHISQLKKLAEQVDVSYEYLDYSDEILGGVAGDYLVNSYSISVNLISDELYLYDGYNEYYYDSFNNGIVNFNRNSGTFEIKVLSKRCAGYKLRTIYVSLPKFNTYSYRQECQDLKEYDLDVCDPWYQGAVNDNIFYREVNKYIKEEKDEGFSFQDIIDFLGDNYLYVGGGLLVILLIIIGIIVYRKRSVLE